MTYSLRNAGRDAKIKGAAKLPIKLAALDVVSLTKLPQAGDLPSYLALRGDGSVVHVYHDGIGYMTDTSSHTREDFRHAVARTDTTTA